LADEVRKGYSGSWDAYRKRLEREGHKVLGFLKLVDVGWQGEKVHFHLAVAVPRMKLKVLPDYLKPDKGLWPYLTRVEFVKWDVEKYLANYLKKPLFELPKGWRSYEVRIYEDRLAKLNLT